ncbi:MAG TPA: hypothetical protein VKE94_20490 [Gemmataceae bacterium]|nr:hypothetical protein [Gemmataceae bacterium]
MIPILPQPAGLVEPSAEQHPRTLAYEQILAYYRGDLANPDACAAVEDQLRRDRRWQAHWDSLRYLDLDRAAALQDAADLARFDATLATNFCRAVAEHGVRIFDVLSGGAESAAGSSRKDWNQHLDECAYCRRMRRLAHARQQQSEAGLPVGEPLLRDWLLQPCYLEALRQATRRLGFELPTEAPETHDTIVSEDTVLRGPPRSGT